ncbi:hypothetical protein [Psychrobacillus sp. FJAT-21963]|uniref:hypothetical protein n=1 Tax=Psychrobacillus sp. FJAT-21963 TaxID=1712028 RepID=UPI000707FCBD|nr:hypothetical protein [Psychrobacillus sp. FJAT-21963]KQL36847.1 hypothetical protein AN959_01935 [Psychrobacillus sp. FJAT-21963]
MTKANVTKVLRVPGTRNKEKQKKKKRRKKEEKKKKKRRKKEEKKKKQTLKISRKSCGNISLK